MLERSAGCLPPVLLDPVVDDPEAVRDLARANGPYFMPARYLIDSEAADRAGVGDAKRRLDVPANLIGPVWRGDWCTGGRASIDGVDHLLHLPGFVDGARQICQAEVVVPEQVYVNLNTPASGAGFSHVDIPEFVGMDRTNTPGWLLQAMGGSHLFEDVRITIITAVAWFYQGERGFFRYWPEGRDTGSIRHENMWNTAVVGDNDFMHHQVERVGPDDLGRPDGMTIDTTLDFDGERWCVVDDGTTLAEYGDEHVRLSLSWKAKVYATSEIHEKALRGDNAMNLPEALDRFAAALDEPLAATGPDALGSPELRAQVVEAFVDYRYD